MEWYLLILNPRLVKFLGKIGLAGIVLWAVMVFVFGANPI